LMRFGERGAPPLSRARRREREPDAGSPASEAAETIVVATRERPIQAPRRERPRYPPPPSEQMSFEDAPPSED